MRQIASQTQYTMPDEMVQLVNFLCAQTHVPGMSTTVFHRPSASASASATSPGLGNGPRASSSLGVGGGSRSSHSSSSHSSNSGWTSVRAPPKSALNTAPVDAKTADLNQLRLLLNKVSDRTYLDLRERLQQAIPETMARHRDAHPSVGRDVAEAVYSICASNKFFAQLFADLYADLATDNAALREHLDAKTETLYDDLYSQFEYVDAEVDYDRFCAVNKHNEKRKSVVQFHVFLVRNGFMPAGPLVALLERLLHHVRTLLWPVHEDPATVQARKHEVDEWVEHLALFLGTDLALVNKASSSRKTAILKSLREIASTKPKDCPALSSKSVFKLMDALKM